MASVSAVERCLVYVILHDKREQRPSLPPLFVRSFVPAARLDVFALQTPVGQFIFEQRPTDVRRIMQSSRAVVVQYLREHTGMPIEEILVENRIVVGQLLGEFRQARGRQFLQR